MEILSFADFIAEKSFTGDRPNHIEDIEIEDKHDDETEEEVEKYLDKKGETCPRCGEDIEDCTCEEEDPWSTQNFHRAPKGKLKKNKPKQNFKQD
jgi:hypothetical protein